MARPELAGEASVCPRVIEVIVPVAARVTYPLIVLGVHVRSVGMPFDLRVEARIGGPAMLDGCRDMPSLRSMLWNVSSTDFTGRPGRLRCRPLAGWTTTTFMAMLLRIGNGEEQKHRRQNRESFLHVDLFLPN